MSLKGNGGIFKLQVWAELVLLILTCLSTPGIYTSPGLMCFSLKGSLYLGHTLRGVNANFVARCQLI